MAVLKCKMCGGTLTVAENTTVCECEYCGSTQTVPKGDDDKKITLYERANRLRFNCEFDKAASVYEALVADFKDEAEAYWGLILCKYGIEYVDDPLGGKKVPTCHRSSFDSVMDDKDFEMVMENSDSASRQVYREQAKQIEEIRKGIIEVSGKEEPYDIFICYKETAEDGQRTIDSVLAQDVYSALTDKGYRVFFSRITLEDKLGTEYEPYIFAALNSAKIMLALGTKYDYYNAVWVKNEWSRYLKLMTIDKSKHLIPCYKDIDAYDMPKEFARLQAQDLGKVGAVQDLLHGIDKILGTKEKKENNDKSVSVDSMYDRVKEYIEDGDWSKASDYCNRILDIDVAYGRVYPALLLIETRKKTIEELLSLERPISSYKVFQKILKYSDSKVVAELKQIDEELLGKQDKKRKQKKKIVVRMTVAAVAILIITGGIYLWVNQIRPNMLENKAQKLFAAEEFESGKDVLASYMPLSDAEGIANQKKYDCAVQSMNKSQYEKAVALFESLGGYKDSQDKLEEISYTNAKSLENEGKYELALKEYEKLVNGKFAEDVQKRVTDCKVKIFTRAMSENDYATAIAYSEDIYSMCSEDETIPDEYKEYFLKLGEYYFQNHQYAETVTWYDRANLSSYDDTYLDVKIAYAEELLTSAETFEDYYMAAQMLNNARTDEKTKNLRYEAYYNTAINWKQNGDKKDLRVYLINLLDANYADIKDRKDNIVSVNFPVYFSFEISDVKGEYSSSGSSVYFSKKYQYDLGDYSINVDLSLQDDVFESVSPILRITYPNGKSVEIKEPVVGDPVYEKIGWRFYASVKPLVSPKGKWNYGLAFTESGTYQLEAVVDGMTRGKASITLE